MTNKEKFMYCCQSLADIEQCITILKDVGLIAGPSYAPNRKNFSNYLYDSCTGMISVAMSYLDYTNIDSKRAEEIYDVLISADVGSYRKIAEEIWSQYGAK